LRAQSMGNYGESWNYHTEEAEQLKFVEWLEAKNILYAHVPNGGKRTEITGARLKKAGTKRGVPDLLIFDRPPKRPEVHSIAVEMKRQGGKSRVTAEQKRWMDELSKRGWGCHVAYGAYEAIKFMESMGF